MNAIMGHCPTVQEPEMCPAPEGRHVGLIWIVTTFLVVIIVHVQMVLSLTHRIIHHVSVSAWFPIWQL